MENQTKAKLDNQNKAEMGSQNITEMDNWNQEEIYRKEIQEIAKITELLKTMQNLNVVENAIAGKGSFGQVWYVENQEGEMYALKVISLSDDGNSVCEARQNNAKNEAKTLEQFDHPNIVKIFDHFQIGIYYFILMEKCEMSLQEFVDRGLHKNIGINRFIKYAKQYSCAIKYVHKKNCIIRDVALKNTLLDKYDNIKICDFGTAIFFMTQLTNETLINSSLELEGTILYYPPEILFQDQKQDQTGDIWAFGICLFILSGVSQVNVYQCITGNQQFINQYSFDSNIKKIILKILERNPLARPSIDQIHDDFNNYSNIIKDYPQLNLVDSNQIELNEQNIEIVHDCDTPHDKEQNLHDSSNDDGNTTNDYTQNQQNSNNKEETNEQNNNISVAYKIQSRYKYIKENTNKAEDNIEQDQISKNCDSHQEISRSSYISNRQNQNDIIQDSNIQIQNQNIIDINNEQIQNNFNQENSIKNIDKSFKFVNYKTNYHLYVISQIQIYKNISKYFQLLSFDNKRIQNFQFWKYSMFVNVNKQQLLKQFSQSQQTNKENQQLKQQQQFYQIDNKTSNQVNKKNKFDYEESYTLQKIKGISKKLKYPLLINHETVQNIQEYFISMLNKKENKYLFNKMPIYHELKPFCEIKPSNPSKQEQVLKEYNNLNIMKTSIEFNIGKYYVILINTCKQYLLYVIDKSEPKNFNLYQFTVFEQQIVCTIKQVSIHGKNKISNDLTLKDNLLGNDDNIQMCNFEIAKFNHQKNNSLECPYSYLKLTSFYPPLSQNNFKNIKSKMLLYFQQTEIENTQASSITMQNQHGGSYIYNSFCSIGYEWFKQQNQSVSKTNQIIQKTKNTNHQKIPNIDKIQQIKVNLNLRQEENRQIQIIQNQVFFQRNEQNCNIGYYLNSSSANINKGLIHLFNVLVMQNNQTFENKNSLYSKEQFCQKGTNDMASSLICKYSIIDNSYLNKFKRQKEYIQYTQTQQYNYSYQFWNIGLTFTAISYLKLMNNSLQPSLIKFQVQIDYSKSNQTKDDSLKYLRVIKNAFQLQKYQLSVLIKHNNKIFNFINQTIIHYQQWVFGYDQNQVQNYLKSHSNESPPIKFICTDDQIQIQTQYDYLKNLISLTNLNQEQIHQNLIIIVQNDALFENKHLISHTYQFNDIFMNLIVFLTTYNQYFADNINLSSQIKFIIQIDNPQSSISHDDYLKQRNLMNANQEQIPQYYQNNDSSDFKNFHQNDNNDSSSIYDNLNTSPQIQNQNQIDHINLQYQNKFIKKQDTQFSQTHNDYLNNPSYFVDIKLKQHNQQQAHVQHGHYTVNIYQISWSQYGQNTTDQNSPQNFKVSGESSRIQKTDYDPNQTQYDYPNQESNLKNINQEQIPQQNQNNDQSGQKNLKQSVDDSSGIDNNLSTSSQKQNKDLIDHGQSTTDQNSPQNSQVLDESSSIQIIQKTYYDPNQTQHDYQNQEINLKNVNQEQIPQYNQNNDQSDQKNFNQSVDDSRGIDNYLSTSSSIQNQDFIDESNLLNQNRSIQNQQDTQSENHSLNNLIYLVNTRLQQYNLLQIHVQHFDETVKRISNQNQVSTQQVSNDSPNIRVIQICDYDPNEIQNDYLNQEINLLSLNQEQIPQYNQNNDKSDQKNFNQSDDYSRGNFNYLSTSSSIQNQDFIDESNLLNQNRSIQKQQDTQSQNHSLNNHIYLVNTKLQQYNLQQIHVQHCDDTVKRISDQNSVSNQQVSNDSPNIQVIQINDCDANQQYDNQQVFVVEWIDNPKDQKNFTSSNEQFNLSTDFDNLTTNLQSFNQNETDERNYLFRNKQQRQIRIQY